MYRLRVAVFIVEQACVFQDVDGVDPECWHLLGRSPSLGQGAASPSPGHAARSPSPGRGQGEGRGPLLAYCRLVPPGAKFPEASIGRVLTTEAGRRKGLGRELMAEALRRARELWPGMALRIGAQQYLEAFYGGFGFARCSEPYDEDGIMHIEMLKR
jgi:ElaA protein